MSIGIEERLRAGAAAGLRLRSITGDPEVAEIAVHQVGGNPRHCIETVDGLAPPLPRREKWIINVSTQIGCPLGCPFCDAGRFYGGDLDVEQLLAQVRWALARHPGMAARCAKLKVHFARMGEPALNSAVLEAMRRLPGVVASPGLWCCVATTAPRGREAWFAALREIKAELYPGRFQLQFSIQSTDEGERARLIPVPHWPLSRIACYGERFFAPGDRKVVLNFALARGIPFAPEVIEGLFDPACFAVKLTPVNPTVTGRERGIRTVLRGERDPLLEAACARLREAGFDGPPGNWWNGCRC